MSYPAIADHGLIGDLQTAALVSTDGTVDWLCLPRFDSPSVFASLLDDRKGGQFSLTTVSPNRDQKMYLPDTAMLVTRYLSRLASPRLSTSCRSIARPKYPTAIDWFALSRGSRSGRVRGQGGALASTTAANPTRPILRAAQPGSSPTG